jgi:hypothetical protein
MSRCVWRHKLTTLSVVAFAIGGKDAQDRVPNRKDSPQGETSGDTGDWSNFQGRWNLGRKDADGNVVAIAPKISPEEDERRKMKALAQLMGVQSLSAKSSGNRLKGTSQDVVAVLDPAAKFQDQLTRAKQRDNEE